MNLDMDLTYVSRVIPERKKVDEVIAGRRLSDGPLGLPNDSRIYQMVEASAVALERRGDLNWRTLLDLSLCAVHLQPAEEQLKVALAHQAAVALAWIDDIDRRGRTAPQCDRPSQPAGAAGTP